LIVTVGWAVSIVKMLAELVPVFPTESDCDACAVYCPSGRTDAAAEYEPPPVLSVSVCTSVPDVFGPRRC